jgi:hypothetical protein
MPLIIPSVLIRRTHSSSVIIFPCVSHTSRFESLARLKGLKRRTESALVGTWSTAKTKQFVEHLLCRTAPVNISHKLTWVHCWENRSGRVRENKKRVKEAAHRKEWRFGPDGKGLVLPFSSRKRRSGSSGKLSECCMLHASALAKGNELFCVGRTKILMLLRLMKRRYVSQGLPGSNPTTPFRMANGWTVRGEIMIFSAMVDSSY